jgi:hypothetical protein
MLCWQVRMQVDISQVNKSESAAECLYAITFTLISGRTFLIPTLQMIHQFQNTSRPGLVGSLLQCMTGSFIIYT